MTALVRGFAGASLVALVLPVAAAAQTATLELADAARIRGRSFDVSVTHAVHLENEHGSEGGRETRLGVHVLEASDAAGNTVAVTLRVDSARASASTPHGREVVDTRPLRASTHRVTYARAGGPATYSPAPPVLDFGELMGGQAPLSFVLNNLFPAMPGRAVRAGDTWTRSWNHGQVNGTGYAERQVNGTFRLVRVQRQHGGSVARVEFEFRADAAGDAGGAIAAKGH